MQKIHARVSKHFTLTEVSSSLSTKQTTQRICTVHFWMCRFVKQTLNIYIKFSIVIYGGEAGYLTFKK